MPIDFSLAPKISGSDYLGPLQAMELGRQSQRDAIRQQQADAAVQQRKDALAQYSAGDTQGAQKAAVASGDFDLADHLTKVDDNHRQQLSQVYGTVLQSAYALKSLPPEQRQAAFDAQAPRLQALGVPPETIAEYRGKLDDHNLDALGQQSMSVLEQIKAHETANKPVVVGAGDTLVNPSTGAMIATNPKPNHFIPVQGTDEQDRPFTQFVEVGPNGAPVNGQPGVGGGANIAQGGGGAPRSVRNNNPGNIKDGSFARSQPGYLGSDGTFAKFADPGAGAGAQAALLGRYMDKGLNTVQSIINRWAPPSDNNDTSSYVANVARALNVNPGDTLSKASIPALQAAIARQEGAPGNASSGVPAGGNTIIRGPSNKSQRMTPAEVAAEGLPAGKVYYRGPDGIPKAVDGQAATKSGGVQLTESQSKAVSLLNTVVESTNALNTIKGYNPSVLALGLNTLSAGNPLREGISQTDRRALNAQLAFATAVLRLESGAAVSKQEAADKAKTLFPLPGDGRDVQADKRALREAAIRGLRTVAGAGSATVPAAVAPGSNGNAMSAKGATAQAAPVKVNTPADAMKLAPGTHFITPDGRHLIR